MRELLQTSEMCSGRIRYDSASAAERYKGPDTGFFDIRHVKFYTREPRKCR